METTEAEVNVETTITKVITTASSDGMTTRLSCDFEKEISSASCYLYADEQQYLRWTRWKGLTPSGDQNDRRINGKNIPATGPEEAYEGDYYMYIEVSNVPANEMAR